VPVRFSDTTGLQRERNYAGGLTFQNREGLFVCLPERAAVEGAQGLGTEMEQMRLRGGRFGGYAGITEAGRVISQRHVLVGAISGDQMIEAHAGRGRCAGQARST